MSHMTQTMDAYFMYTYGALAVVLIQKEEKRRKRRRTYWVRPWLIRRPLYGQFEKLMAELQVEDVASFRNFLRVSPEFFQELLEKIGPTIHKANTFWRQSLEPGIKLAVTLRYLATGNSYRSLQYGFRVACNTICNFIPEVCQAIVDAYCDKVLALPTTTDRWMAIAEEFETKWNLPHCIGALDGKHVLLDVLLTLDPFTSTTKGSTP